MHHDVFQSMGWQQILVLSYAGQSPKNVFFNQIICMCVYYITRSKQKDKIKYWHDYKTYSYDEQNLLEKLIPNIMSHVCKTTWS